MERLSDSAITIINELHTERLDYYSEYLPLINAAQRLYDYEWTGLEPEQVADMAENAETRLLTWFEAKYGMAVGKLMDLLEAKQDGRLLILPDESAQQRICVEAAMGFKLYDWQVAYIWTGSRYAPPGRRVGRTTAYILHACLSKGEPLHLYVGGKNFHSSCDEGHGPQYAETFRRLVYDTYLRLKDQGGLKLRKIYFSRMEAKIDGDGEND